ncbi:MAG: glycosyltransferase family 2 protein [bacterium]|nr:glycosyltransferase family 2 protein [bacterium]
MYKSNLTITVIILHYGDFSLTRECIDSVLKSTYSHFDILVVDNASPNNSFKQLQKKYLSHKKIQLVRSKINLLFTGGFNYGAQYAKGKYIVLLSNDIVVHHDWLLHLVHCFQMQPKSLIQPKIMTYRDRRIIDNVGGTYNIFGFGRGVGGGEIDRGQYDRYMPLSFTSATTCAIDRKWYLSLGGYDEWFASHYEDVDLSLRVKKEGGICFTCWQSTIYHKGSMTYKKYVPNKDVMFHVRKNRLQLIVKNYKGLEKIVRLTFVLVTNFISIMVDLSRLNFSYAYITTQATIVGLFRLSWRKE